jgi:hypothetical protein
MATWNRVFNTIRVVYGRFPLIADIYLCLIPYLRGSIPCRFLIKYSSRAAALYARHRTYSRDPSVIQLLLSLLLWVSAAKKPNQFV